MPRRTPAPIETVEIDAPLNDGQELTFTGGLSVVHTPGHTAGHVAFLWPHQGGVLFVGDACTNMYGLGDAPIYEDYLEGLRSLKKLTALPFGVICFSHGNPLRGNCVAAFCKKWG